MAEGTPKLTKVTINGIDVTNYLSPGWELVSTQGSSPIKNISITLVKAVESILTIDAELNGYSVTIQRGTTTAIDEYVFRGEIVNVHLNAGTIDIYCSDKLFLTTKATVTKSYDYEIETEAGVISEIFKDLINNFTSLYCDNTTVINSGTTFILKKFICRSVTVFDRLCELAEALSWQFYYNPVTDKVYFEPKGYLNQSTLLKTGVNIVNKPKWNYDATSLYNHIELRGAYQEVETTEVGTLGITTGYTVNDVLLTKQPISVKLYLDGVLKIGGVPGSTSAYDYSVNTTSKLITFKTVQSSSQVCTINYSYALPTPVIVSDQESIETYSDDGITPKKISFTKKDITNISDAETYANQYLIDHKDPIAKTKLYITNVKDLEVGQMVPIIDTVNNVSGQFIITSIKRKYPYVYDEIDIVSNVVTEDDYLWNTIQRVKRLEEQNQNDSDVLLHVLGMTTTNKYENREIVVYHKDTTTDNIWGRELWGSYEWQQTNNESESLKYMIPGNNKFDEYVYDSDYYDSSTSGSITWDTTTNKMEVAVGGSFYTYMISFGIPYRYFTLKLNNPINTFNRFYISADNKSTWQLISFLNSKTPFNSSDGTGVYIKCISESSGGKGFAYAFPIVFTPSSGSLVSVQSLKSDAGQLLAPAISVILEE